MKQLIQVHQMKRMSQNFLIMIIRKKERKFLMNWGIYNKS